MRGKDKNDKMTKKTMLREKCIFSNLHNCHFFWAIFGAIFDKNMEKSKIIRKMKKMTMRGEK